MPHPYTEFEGTPLWAALEHALAELSDNHLLTLTTAPPYVVGLLCRRLSEAGVPGQEPTAEQAR